MLREISETRQIRGEPRRRWFNSESMDLFIWYDPDGEPLGFQLCYGKPVNERALTWFRPASYSHMRVNASGQEEGTRTPILVADGLFERDPVRAEFTREARGLPTEVVTLVLERLGGFPV